MANIKFPRKEFEKHLKLTKEIEEKISLFGTHFESSSPEEVEIEVTANRPDLLSLHGFMRSFLLFAGKGKKKEYSAKKPEKDYRVIIDKSVASVRPFTACAIVKNLKFDDEKIKEVIDIQEKIHATLGRNRKKIAIGIYPLEKITLPIRFEARAPPDIKFIPLEFERELNGMQILQQHPTGREYGHLLEGKEKFPIFVDAKNDILSMPPIINSHKTGKITQETRDIFIECSGFEFEVLSKTLNILATMLADMGGEIYQMELEYPKKVLSPNLEPDKMKLDIQNACKLLGLELKEKEIRKLLEKMGHVYENSEVLSPCYRADIMHEVDLIEDIAIAYGYEKIIPEMPSFPGTGEEDGKEKAKRKIAEILAGLGLLEISSLHLLTKEEAKRAGIRNAVEVEKSKSEYRVLRTNLLTPLLRTLSGSIDSEYPQKVFEIGAVFSKDEKEETGVKEEDKLLVALSPGNFTELKQIMDYLGKMLDKKLEIEEAEETCFISGRTAKVKFNSKSIGILGEISPYTLKTWHLKMPASVFEINLEEVLN